ncbi:hypothetical protein ST47_g6121 [Ascochyta rabiei]|uniref:Uncharacterized protein n=1 Tax=Didymella rabiei TaxID=5454 RepID=A0A163CUT3_DIDRA|nr:hypothetical protein ST47_g6121 [Ascochyta rabiei]
MRVSRFIFCIPGAGSLLATSALLVDTHKVHYISSLPTKMLTPYPYLGSRQDLDSASATGPPIARTALVDDPLQPSVLVPPVSNTSADLPTVIPVLEAQVEYTPKRDNFGSRSILVVFGVIGVLVLIVTVWAIIAHRDGRRLFACFGGCSGRGKDVEAARSGSMDSDIPFIGAGRHCDRRPVSIQPQLCPMPMPAPQRPEPVRHEIPRRPVVELEWARQF